MSFNEVSVYIWVAFPRIGVLPVLCHFFSWNLKTFFLGGRGEQKRGGVGRRRKKQNTKREKIQPLYGIAFFYGLLLFLWKHQSEHFFPSWPDWPSNYPSKWPTDRLTNGPTDQYFWRTVYMSKWFYASPLEEVAVCSTALLVDWGPHTFHRE